MEAFDFAAQMAVGDKGEAFLDSYFGKWYWIVPVPDDLQRFGIDRIYISRSDLTITFVEYKTDWKAGETSNAFIETVSIVEFNKAGWIYTSRAGQIIYFIPPMQRIYIVKPDALRGQVKRWSATYPTKDVPNKNWTTRGVIVPLHEFEDIAKVIQLAS